MLSSGRQAPGAYTSLIDGGRQILRKEGLAGFYRGTLTGLFGILQGAGQFTLYEEFKGRQLRRHRARGQTRPKLDSVEALWTSGLAKVLSTVATYPYQVVRARLQSYDADKRYGRMRDVINVTWRREGLRGFYKGYVLPALDSAVLSFCPRHRIYLFPVWPNRREKRSSLTGFVMLQTRA
jgi:solute carrier family 25 folate transporter 32